MSHKQILVVLSGLMLVLLLAALDQTIVSTALPKIVSELGGLSHYSWVVTAYLLASTASTPLYGKISDLLGRKKILQTAIVIFLIGSVLCGVAQNIWQLIAFRGLQGLGGGGLIAMTMATVGDVVPPRQRGRYQGYFGAIFALASVAGPLLGGFFTDHATWRWIFYINVPLGILAFLVLAAVLHIPVRHTKHRIDYLGAALIVICIVAILLFTTWGGNTYAWKSPQIFSLVGIALVSLIAFLFVEHKASEPILPLHLFRDRVFSLSIGLSLISGVALFGAIVYLPEYLQVVKGNTATRSGLLLLPLTFGIVLSSMLSGQIISRIGRYKIFPILGTAILGLGLWLLSHIEVDTSLVEFSIWVAVIGLGVGFFLQVIVLAVQNSARPENLGTATSSVTFFRSLGGSVGTAVFGSILTARLASELPKLLPADTGKIDVSQAINSASAIRTLPSPVRDAVLEAMVRSFHVLYLTALPFAILGLILAFFLPERSLHGGDHSQVDSEQKAQNAKPALATVQYSQTDALSAGVMLAWIADYVERANGNSPRLLAAAAALVPLQDGQSGEQSPAQIRQRADHAANTVLRPAAAQLLAAAVGADKSDSMNAASTQTAVNHKES